MRLAYADPPYLGLCSYYQHRHEEPWGCWDEIATHADLFAYLEDFDGWAVSCHSPVLGQMLDLAPADTRVAAWVKPFPSRLSSPASGSPTPGSRSCSGQAAGSGTALLRAATSSLSPSRSRRD